MFEAVGCDVKALKRTTFAGLTLAGVKRGAHRKLTQAELAHLRALAGLAAPHPAGQGSHSHPRPNVAPKHRSEQRAGLQRPHPPAGMRSKKQNGKSGRPQAGRRRK